MMHFILFFLRLANSVADAADYTVWRDSLGG